MAEALEGGVGEKLFAKHEYKAWVATVDVDTTDAPDEVLAKVRTLTDNIRVAQSETDLRLTTGVAQILKEGQSND